MVTLGTRPQFTGDATLKGLRPTSAESHPVANPSELRRNKCALFTQGFKANPGLEFANAFSVISSNLTNAFGLVGLADERGFDFH